MENYNAFDDLINFEDDLKEQDKTTNVKLTTLSQEVSNLKRKRSVSTDSMSSQEKEENLELQLENSVQANNFWDFRKNLLALDKIKSKEIAVSNCKHFVFWHKNQKTAFIKKNPVSDFSEYKFEYELDSFQKESILAIENKENVLVSAHTSAGKTTVAIYAIALALKNNQRVIYTSPIKALSNQKLREFRLIFGENQVGLMTGDVTINPNALCIIMTAEIYRDMLFRGSSIVYETRYIVFDEIHYMRDKERGVVWEETLVLLPQYTNIVMLSATVPNAHELATWVVRLKGKPCHVVYTEFRPVPLKHYVLPTGSKKIFLICDEEKQFKKGNYDKVLEEIEGNDAKRQNVMKDVVNLINLLKQDGLFPAICFSFNRRRCEELAKLIKDYDLVTPQDKAVIEEIWRRAISTLNEEDQALKSITIFKDFLVNGIGIHHSGLFPIVKEVVEILFQENYIKVLFTTETFAMGVNMPAKTVIFTDLDKFDGSTRRMVTGSEFTQMSGRAGRRGKDDCGRTITLLAKKTEEKELKNIMCGDSEPLNSSFQIGYSTLLKMMKTEGYDPELVIRKSFLQHQREASVPSIKKKVKELDKQISDMKIDPRVLRRLELQDQLVEQQEKKYDLIHDLKLLVPVLVEGRMLRIRTQDPNPIELNAMVVGLKAHKKSYDELNSMSSLDQRRFQYNIFQNNIGDIYYIDVQVVAQVYKNNEFDIYNDTVYRRVPLKLNNLLSVFNMKIREEQFIKILNSPKEGDEVGKIIELVNEDYQDNLQDIDFSKDLSEEKLERYNSICNTIKTIQNDTIMKEIDLNDSLIKKITSSYEAKRKTLNMLKVEVEKSSSTVLFSMFESMKTVLLRRNFIDIDLKLTTKGELASNIRSGDEILMTEILLSNFFEDIEPSYVAGVLSVFVNEKTADNKAVQFSSLNDKRMNAFVEEVEDGTLRKHLKEFYQLALLVGRVMEECGVGSNATAYADGFSSSLCQFTLLWAQGKTFDECLESTSEYEGNIVRIVKRLEQLLEKLSDSCKIIQNNKLNKKIEEARKMIKRGIVFTASLWTGG